VRAVDHKRLFLVIGSAFPEPAPDGQAYRKRQSVPGLEAANQT